MTFFMRIHIQPANIWHIWHRQRFNLSVYNRAGNICWTKITSYKSWRALISTALFHHNCYIKYLIFTHASSSWVVIRGDPEAKLKTRVNCKHLWAPFDARLNLLQHLIQEHSSFKSKKITQYHICIMYHNKQQIIIAVIYSILI